jgi:hypothetical protein
MKNKIQNLIINLIIVFIFLTVIEYLLKFGVNNFEFNKLMDVIPRLVIDFGLIALFYIVFYLIKFKRKK